MRKQLISFLILGLFFTLTASGQPLIELKNKREIFIDNYLIEKFYNTAIKLHHPHDEGIVMPFDKPWEGLFSGYCTILKDENLYRAYYRGMKNLKAKEYTCYAESKDGIHWNKPSLGLCEVDGSRNNNVILDLAPVTHNFSPFIDKNPDMNPDQKYKALGGNSITGLIPYTSHDGIHWKSLSSKGVITKGAFDSQNVVFWSESEKQYVCYLRIYTGGIRTVGRCTSTDFITWSEPVEMSYGDSPREQLYTQQTSPYYRAPHIYVAIGGRFMPGRQVMTEEQAKALQVDPGYFKDCSDAFLMTSRGGSVYDRTFMEAFIRPGIGMDNWVSRSNYPALNVVQTSDTEMSVYVNQDYAQPDAHLRRYSMRIDGFSSISAPYSGGEIITKPFTFTGTKLEINYSTSAPGEIRIEIQDKNGIPLPGYALADSKTIIGNEISRIVEWNTKKDVTELISKTVRLRIIMKDADLYSIKFSD